MAKLTKALLSCGDHFSPDGKLTVTPQRIQHWANSFAAMADEGIQIPVGVNHSDKLEQNVPFQMSGGGDASKAVGKLVNLVPTPDGQALEFHFDIGENSLKDIPHLKGFNPALARSMAGKAFDNVVECSPVILDYWTDGKANEWEDVITHADLVVHPVDHNQTPFKSADGVLACSIRLGLGTKLLRPKAVKLAKEKAFTGKVHKATLAAKAATKSLNEGTVGHSDEAFKYSTSGNHEEAAKSHQRASDYHKYAEEAAQKSMKVAAKHGGNVGHFAERAKAHHEAFVAHTKAWDAHRIAFGHSYYKMALDPERDDDTEATANEKSHTAHEHTSAMYPNGEHEVHGHSEMALTHSANGDHEKAAESHIKAAAAHGDDNSGESIQCVDAHLAAAEAHCCSLGEDSMALSLKGGKQLAEKPPKKKSKKAPQAEEESEDEDAEEQGGAGEMGGNDEEGGAGEGAVVVEEEQNPDLLDGTDKEAEAQKIEAIMSRLPTFGIALPADTCCDNFYDRLLTAMMTVEANDAIHAANSEEQEPEEDNPDYKESSPAFAAMSLKRLSMESEYAHGLSKKAHKMSHILRFQSVGDLNGQENSTSDLAKQARDHSAAKRHKEAVYAHQMASVEHGKEARLAEDENTEGWSDSSPEELTMAVKHHKAAAKLHTRAAKAHQHAISNKTHLALNSNVSKHLYKHGFKKTEGDEDWHVYTHPAKEHEHDEIQYHAPTDSWVHVGKRGVVESGVGHKQLADHIRKKFPRAKDQSKEPEYTPSGHSMSLEEPSNNSEEDTTMPPEINEKATAAFTYAEGVHRESIKTRLGLLFKSGRITKAEMDDQEKLLPMIKLSLNADSQPRKSKVELFIESRETLPAGCAWKPEDRMRLATEAKPDAQVFGDDWANLSPEEEDAKAEEVMTEMYSRGRRFKEANGKAEANGATKG